MERTCSSYVLAAFLLGLMAPVASGADSTLTQVAHVRRLTPEQAAQRIPIDVEGVVTHPYMAHSFFLHDGEEGIWVGLKQGAALKHGQKVRVTGRSGPGEFAPVSREANVVVIGPGKMPEAQSLSLDGIKTGAVDSQWLEMEGIVRAVFGCLDGRQEMELSTFGLRLRVEVANCPSELIGADLVGAHVRVRGVAVTHWNSRRQLRRVWLAVPDPAFIIITTPAIDNTSIRLEEIRTLLRFSPDRSSEHRVSVNGVVTYFAPGQFLYMQDKTGALMARTRQTAGAAVGDIVEVTGFPAASEFSPVLEHASVVQVSASGRSEPPRARRISDPAKLFSPEFHGELVELEGILVDQLRQASDDVLLLQAGDRLFQAVLPSIPALQERSRVGSRLRVTGIYVAEESVGDQYMLVPQVTGFRVLLRHAGDLVVLAQPSWWTRQRLWQALWALLLVVVGIGGVVVLLSRRVRKQEVMLRANLERELIMEERTRIGRELHDTLVQGFAGVSFQLQALLPQLSSAPAGFRQQIELALNMAHHSMAEARRSVWELRSGGLEHISLLDAIKRSTQLLVAGNSIGLEFSTHGQPHSLSPEVENELLRLAQESVANAVKHSSARQIWIELDYEPEFLRLMMRDNGSGFESNGEPSPNHEHFGIIGMRERASRIGARLQIESAAGCGTCVRVVLPISHPAKNGDTLRTI